MSEADSAPLSTGELSLVVAPLDRAPVTGATSSVADAIVTTWVGAEVSMIRV
ncbi:hypothetical protein D3C84_1228530 [compost metagenome]